MEGFSIKSAFKALKEESWNSKDELWKRVWKIPGPQIVRLFFWTVFKERFLTNAKRVRCGLVVDPSCTLTKEVKRQVVPRPIQFSFFTNNLQDWLSLNLQLNSQNRVGEAT